MCSPHRKRNKPFGTDLTTRHNISSVAEPRVEGLNHIISDGRGLLDWQQVGTYTYPSARRLGQFVDSSKFGQPTKASINNSGTLFQSINWAREGKQFGTGVPIGQKAVNETMIYTFFEWSKFKMDKRT